MALNPIVDLRDFERGLLLAFIILHQQARDGRTESRLSRLQCDADLISRRAILALPRERERAIHRIPELRE